MESKIYIKERGKTKNSYGLLPNYFRKIGLAIMLLALFSVIIFKLTGLEISAEQKPLIRLLTMNIFILGLLFIAWCRDKVEDEMTVSLRLKSMSLSFIWAVLYVILRPFTDIIFKDPIKDLKAQELVFSMLFFYLVIYFIQKKMR